MKKYLNVRTNIFFVLKKTTWIFMKRKVSIYSCKNIRYNNHHGYSICNQNSALYRTKYSNLQAESVWQDIHVHMPLLSKNKIAPIYIEPKQISIAKRLRQTIGDAQFLIRILRPLFHQIFKCPNEDYLKKKNKLINSVNQTPVQTEPTEKRTWPRWYHNSPSTATLCVADKREFIHSKERLRFQLERHRNMIIAPLNSPSRSLFHRAIYNNRREHDKSRDAGQ